MSSPTQLTVQVVGALHDQTVLAEQRELAMRELRELRATLAMHINDITRLAKIEPSCAAWTNLHRLCADRGNHSSII